MAHFVVKIHFLKRWSSKIVTVVLLVNLATPHITLIPLVNLITLVILFVGAISSDLYRPQSQDETVEFSFFVALSYEYNLQLGCL